MLLKVCLNGPRTRAEHAGVPVTPEQIAGAAAGAVAAGAGAVHLHAKDADGRDSLDARLVDAAVAAVREATTRPLGVTTGAWAQPDPARRAAEVRGWAVPPDFASVNFHEDGAELVADALLEAGVAVEAGLWTLAAVERWQQWGGPTLRVLLEVIPGQGDADPLRQAEGLIEAVGDAPAPLLHGQDDSCWPVFDEAVRRGLDTRIGLEDTLVLPDGTPASFDAELVRAARSRMARNRRPE